MEKKSRTSIHGALCCLLAWSLVLPALGETVDGDLAVVPEIDIPIILSTATVAAAIELIKQERYVPTGFVPSSSRIGFPDRRFAGTDLPHLARTSEYVLWTQLLALPAAYTALSPWSAGLLHDLVLYAEAISINQFLLQLTKAAIARPRPLLYADDLHEREREDRDNYFSFYSGHTAATFASATAITTLAWRRGLSDKAKYGLLGISYTLAATTAALRVASGKHFPTDVVTGAVVGSAVSLLTVGAHVPRDYHNERFAMVTGAGSLGFCFRF